MGEIAEASHSVALGMKIYAIDSLGSSLLRGARGQAHLGVCVDGVEQSAGGCVPEFDAAVGCASARREQVGLEGAPCKSLDGSAMCCHLVLGWAACSEAALVMFMDMGAFL